MSETRNSQNNKISKMGKMKREILLSILAFIFSFSTSMLIIKATNIPLDWITTFLINISIFLVLNFIFYSVKSTLISFILLGISTIVCFIIPVIRKSLLSFIDIFVQKFSSTGELLSSFLDNGFDFFQTSLTSDKMSAYAFSGLLIILVVALTSFFIIQKLCNYWFPWIISIILLAISITIGATNALAYTIPMLIIAIIITLFGSGQILNLLEFKYGDKHIFKASSHLALIIALAILVSMFFTNHLQHKDIYSSYLQGIMDDFMTIFPKSFQPSLTVNSFSIGRDGFYPLGEHRLGGTVELGNKDVVEIKGNVPKLLKVQSSDHYNGLSWYRTVNNPNYRYDSPFNNGSELEIFNPPMNINLNNELNEDIDNNVAEIFTYDLKPITKGSQILFLSGTPLELKSSRDEALLFYFNQASTVYAKSFFNNNHYYTVSTSIIDAKKLGFSTYSINDKNTDLLKKLDIFVSSAKAKNNSLANYKNAYENYLQLPDYDIYKKDGEIYNLALKITDNSKGNLSKLESILEFFKYNRDFSYSLDVITPPENMDFLQHFLDTKVGYCTYYATAMTIFARLNNIPARYVEGYSLNQLNFDSLDLGKTTKLSSKNAHAWTEIYLDGIGWIALDPTPSSDSNANPTPTPTPSPTPTYTTKTSTTPSTTTSKTTSTDVTNTTETSTSTSVSQDNNDKTIVLNLFLRTFLIVSLLLLIAATMYIYYKKRKKYIESLHDISFIKGKLNNSKAIVNFYWNELLNLQHILIKFMPGNNITEIDLGKLLNNKFEKYADMQNELTAKINTNNQKNDYDNINWTSITEIVAEAKYSQHDISDDKIKYLANNFDKLEEMLMVELGNIAYIRKRILPPRQGKIN